MPSRDHDDIVQKAVVWLKQHEFVDIIIEARIIVVGDSAGKLAPKSGNPHGTTLIPDVIGYRNACKAIVECGSIRELSKLYLLKDLGYEVYLWPYDVEEPYLWSEDTSFCRRCGRKFGRLDRIL